MAGSASDEDGSLGFQIAPMVDVVFVLLMFFMLFASTKMSEKELSINLPTQPSRAVSEVVPIFIDIKADGTVAINDRIYGAPNDKALPELKSWLKAVSADYGDKNPVIIRPAPDTRQERIVDVLDACVVGKVKKLTFG